ncbi:LysR family transcriptional regulator clustered with dicarboxylate transport [Acidisarcina polymorpha]|uniref:LysR family transcriptional regulator clustered with dicarboxylate transport n=1 Tax=Acidisarcina polymorpha TaxID=2211140 RepID=A0A2Z5G1P7_9BACT|nr:LysR family transcriptional regulator [Acidisarcina polymorpha]AXC13021.1 LysR family transcriptional regulator clustered with dicarboxylate transport [Acidisarcina polymorpha]
MRQVRAFLKVAELQSFTRAAAELHVSQSALTVQVKQLEEELGVLLFDRNKRGVAITAAGLDLLGPLQRIVLDSEAIVGYARDISAVRTGNLALAALPTIAADLLPRAMDAFLRTNPEVRITVHDVVADRVRELVTKAAVDFGLGTASRQDKELQAYPLYHDHLAAFVPASHDLARRDEVTLRELADCDLILPNRESSVRSIVEATFARAHVQAAVRYETNYMPTAIAFVRRGLGIAILPTSARDDNHEQVVCVRIRKPAMSRQICLLQRVDRSLSPAATSFLHTLRAEIASRNTQRRMVPDPLPEKR